jgi:hypothetical protein
MAIISVMPTPPETKKTRPFALRPQCELAARRHRLDAQTWFPLGVQKAEDQRSPFAVPD